MKCFVKGQRGFTLIEVLISIAIIGLIMLSFLGMYTHGHRWVFNAGSRTTELFTSQEEIEKALAGDTFADVTRYDDSLEITFSGTTVDVDGTRLEWLDEDNNLVIEAFKPD